MSAMSKKLFGGRRISMSATWPAFSTAISLNGPIGFPFLFGGGARCWRLSLDDQRIDYGEAFARVVNDDRVKIDLGYAVDVVMRKMREIDHERGECRDIRRRLPAPRAEHCRCFQPCEQSARGGMIERYRRERHVAKRLDHRPAEADHQERAPVVVAADTENDFAPGPRHFLHQHAVDDRRGGIAFGGSEHTLVSGARSLGSNIERDAAGFGLVRDIGGLNFERDRAAKISSDSFGVFGGINERAGCVAVANIVATQKRHGIPFAQHWSRGREFDAYIVARLAPVCRRRDWLHVLLCQSLAPRPN